MAYTPTAWADGVTPVNASNLNKIETGVDVAHDDIAALSTRIGAEEAQPDIPAVVNGKWVKGVGGAMVWSDIVAADVGGLTALLDAKVDDSEKGIASGVATLDASLRVVQQHTVDKLYATAITEGHHVVARSGASVWEAQAAGVPTRLGDYALTITDWNNATTNGWYMGSGITNAPTPTVWYIGEVFAHDANHVTQRAWNFTVAPGTAPIYERRRIAGAWSAWVPVANFAYILLRHEVAANSPGGASVAGSMLVRPLNTEVADSHGICTLSANQFTLPAGTYRMRGWSVYQDNNNCRTRIYNVTDAATAIAGGAAFLGAGNTSISNLAGVVTTTATKTFQMEYRVQTARATDGLGVPANYGVPEIYASLEIERIA